MCGITGIIRESGKVARPGVIRAMTRRLIHRGPDAEGFFTEQECALGHRRLSVIDLQGGDQPMTSAEGRFVMVYNGEIYNYKELREGLSQQGVSFRTQSDTEVVLASFMKYGPDCLQKMNGMFALAIWDRREKKLFLARDRLGVKPCFYRMMEDGTFLFASEIKALQAYPGFRSSLNPEAIHHLLTYGFGLCPETFVKDVYQVLPGHYLWITLEQVVEKSYWSLEPSPGESAEKEGDWMEGFQHHFSQAVKRRLVADVPVAAYLSGGIDSSAVVAHYSRIARDPVHTFSIGFNDSNFDERGHAACVAGHCHTEHTSFLFEPQIEDLPKYLYHLEDPLVTLLQLPLFYLSRKVTQAGYKVVLSGDGADEFLGGYRYFREMKALLFQRGTQGDSYRAQIFRRLHPELKHKEQLRQHILFLEMQRNGNPRSLPNLPYGFYVAQDTRRLFHPDLMAEFQDDLALPFDPARLEGLNPMEQMFFLESQFRLLNMTLPLSDKMSMAHGLENRSPFLDYELVEYLATMPAHLKIFGMKEKFILKQSTRALLPQAIIDRKKQPLIAPPIWFFNCMREPLMDLLSDTVVRDKGYFNPQTITEWKRSFTHTPADTSAGVLLLVAFIHLWDDLFLKSPGSAG